MSADVLLVGLGAFLVLIGVVGGGFEIKQIRVPTVPKFTRVVSFILGIIFISSYWWLLPRPLEDTSPPIRSSPTIIYVQYRGNGKALAEELNTELNRIGLPAGDEVELVDQDYNNSIKYFHPEDKEAARLVRGYVNGFFSRKDYDVKFPLLDESSAELHAEKGQIEIWINFDIMHHL